MTEKLTDFTGARLLSVEESKDADLGPLTQLVGEWRGAIPANENLIASGWNVISVPGSGGAAFVFEVIPYQEVLKFSPVVIQAGNRGPSINGQQVDQNIFGLMYEQQITSLCTTDFCNERGFSAGTAIHAETGLFLNVGNPNGGFDIARLSTIPHGNALLALGASSVENNPGTNFFPASSAVPTNLDGGPVAILGYTDPVTRNIQFPGVFDQANPNTFLQTSLEAIVGSGSVTDMTTLSMTTNTPNANGGILNIPFIQSNVNATTMDAIFWIENIVGGSASQLLQYTQTINLVFPPTGKATPIVWPHITINTLIKYS